MEFPCDDIAQPPAHRRPRRRRDPWPWMAACCCAFAVATTSINVLGEEKSSKPPKSGHHLFNPVPRGLLRELESDRPDRTESPFTVDAGHFQVEMDALMVTRDRFNSDDADVSVKGLSAANLNLKLGVLNRMDLQFVIPAYNRLHLEATGGQGARLESGESGPGDLRLRTKVNLWGNDGGRTALAVMPFVQFPTGAGSLTAGGLEGGIILPFTLELPAGFGCGIMHEIDFVRDETGKGTNRVFVQSITLGHDLVGPLSGYVEFFSAVGAREPDRWAGTIDGGVNWQLGPDLKLDAGINAGSTRTANDWTFFVGLT